MCSPKKTLDKDSDVDVNLRSDRKKHKKDYRESEAGKVPVKGTSINRFLLTFKITKLNSWKKSQPIFLSNFISSKGILPVVLAEFLEPSLTAHLLILCSQSIRNPNDCLYLPCYHLRPGTIASHASLQWTPSWSRLPSCLASLQQHSRWPSSCHSFPSFHGPFSTM